MQFGPLRGPPAALAGDDLVGLAAASDRADHERLHQPALADRSGKLLELFLGEIASRVEPAGPQRREGDAALTFDLRDIVALAPPMISAAKPPPSRFFCALPAISGFLFAAASRTDSHAARIRRSRSITSEASRI